MATIRATCNECGDVELRTFEVRVRVCTLDDSGTYTFRCPSCRMAVVKPAEPRVVELLAASGVEVFRWDLPAELFEPHQGEPVTHDDLLDFHETLNRDETWFSEIVASLRNGF